MTMKQKPKEALARICIGKYRVTVDAEIKRCGDELVAMETHLDGTDKANVARIGELSGISGQLEIKLTRSLADVERMRKALNELLDCANPNHDACTIINEALAAPQGE